MWEGIRDRMRQDAEIWLLDENNLKPEMLVDWFVKHPSILGSYVKFVKGNRIEKSAAAMSDMR